MSILDRFSEKEQSILKSRAERIAQTVDDIRNVDLIHALTVMIQGEVYALPVDSLVNVYEDANIVPVPCTPSYVSGIANVRGRIVPVFDLADLLNLSADINHEKATLIVATDELVTLAFCVNQVGDILTIASREFGLVHGSNRDEYIQGVLSDGTALVHIKAILSDPRLIVNGAGVN
jgi:purine-binding chemotaxis protein CheW